MQFRRAESLPPLQLQWRSLNRSTLLHIYDMFIAGPAHDIPPQPILPPTARQLHPKQFPQKQTAYPRLFNPAAQRTVQRTTRMASPLRPASDSSPAPAPSAAAAVPNVTCCLCPNEFPLHEVLAFIACCGPEAHVFCNDCFSGMVSAQVSAEGKVSFIQRGLKIECALCM